MSAFEGPAVRDIYVLAVILASIATTGFCLAYGFLAPWWRSHMGRAMMLLGVSLSAATDSISIFAVSQESDTVRWSIFTLFFVMLAVAMFYLTVKVLLHNYFRPLRRLGVPWWQPWRHIPDERNYRGHHSEDRGLRG